MNYPIFPRLKLKPQLGPEVTPRLIELGCSYDKESDCWCAPTAKKAQAARLIIKGDYRKKTGTRFYQRSSSKTFLETGQARTVRHTAKSYPDTDGDEGGGTK